MPAQGAPPSERRRAPVPVWKGTDHDRLTCRHSCSRSRHHRPHGRVRRPVGRPGGRPHRDAARLRRRRPRHRSRDDRRLRPRAGGHPLPPGPDRSGARDRGRLDLPRRSRGLAAAVPDRPRRRPRGDWAPLHSLRDPLARLPRRGGVRSAGRCRPPPHRRPGPAPHRSVRLRRMGAVPARRPGHGRRHRTRPHARHPRRDRERQGAGDVPRIRALRHPSRGRCRRGHRHGRGRLAAGGPQRPARHQPSHPLPEQPLPRGARARGGPMNAVQTPTAPARARLSLREIVLIVVLAVVFGFLYWVFVQAWNGLAIAMGLAGDLAQNLVFGSWLLVAPIALAILRRPGVGVLAEMLAAIIEVVFLGNPVGPLLVLSAALQGIGSELPFALTRYRRYGWGVFAASGALGAGLVFFWTAYRMGWYGQDLLTLRLGVQVLSGIVLGGLLAKVIVRALERTGVLAN